MFNGIIKFTGKIVKVITKNNNCNIEVKSKMKFKNNEIYGPFTPTLASPSDNTMPSAHAEVVGIKYVNSIKNNIKDATLALVHWTYNKKLDDWILANGVPCEDCVRFIEKHNIKKFIISTSTNEKLIKVNFNYIKKYTKKSTGRLFGR